MLLSFAATFLATCVKYIVEMSSHHDWIFLTANLASRAEIVSHSNSLESTGKSGCQQKKASTIYNFRTPSRPDIQPLLTVLEIFYLSQRASLHISASTLWPFQTNRFEVESRTDFK